MSWILCCQWAQMEINPGEGKGKKSWFHSGTSNLHSGVLWWKSSLLFSSACSWSRELDLNSARDRPVPLNLVFFVHLCTESDTSCEIRAALPWISTETRKVRWWVCACWLTDYFVYSYFYSFIVQLVESHSLTVMIVTVSLMNFGSLKLG